MNNYFIDSAPQLPPGNHIASHYDQNKICFSEFNFICEQEVFDALTKIKNTRPGNGKISVQLIKLCVPYILPFLVHLTNTIFLEGKYSKCWKVATIILIPKGNKVEQLSDLHPVQKSNSILENYKCLATNPHGKLEKSFNLHLGYRPDAPLAINLVHATSDSLEFKLDVQERVETLPAVLFIMYRKVDSSQWKTLETNVNNGCLKISTRQVNKGKILEDIKLIEDELCNASNCNDKDAIVKDGVINSTKIEEEVNILCSPTSAGPEDVDIKKMTGTSK
nr:unnamed protein product [Callosobruchus analis]